MDPILLHLRINHFPIVLGVLGAIALISALITNRLTLLRYAQISLLLAGLFAPVAFFSGREAEEHTEHTWYVDRKVVHEHEESGEQATIALVITAILAAASLWKDRKLTRVLLLLGGLASAALVVNAGLHGGKIVHENASLNTQPAGGSAPTPTR